MSAGPSSATNWPQSPFIEPRVGVGVLVVGADGRVLLTLRRRPPEAGCWSIVGGRVEMFERLEECAVREAREEAGVEIVLDRLLCVTDHIVAAERQHWVSPAYLATIVGGEVANLEPDKTVSVQWFDVADLPGELTQTARNAIDAYLPSVTSCRNIPRTCRGDSSRRRRRPQS
jgi:8-oxo-dGTP diphosphatase